MKAAQPLEFVHGRVIKSMPVAVVHLKEKHDSNAARMFQMAA